MLGHGSPLTGSLWLTEECSGHFDLIRLPMLAAFVLAALSSPLVAADGEVDVRLQIVWGGEQRRVVQGDVFLSHGRLGEVQRLGLEADLPGTLEVHATHASFRERTATSFDGLALRVQSNADATLTVRLSAGTEAPQTFRINVSDFLNDGSFHFNAPLEGGHRLVVRRSPGDQLRVHVERDALVFSPGEEFTVRVEPHHCGFAANSSVKCEIQLVDRAGVQQWRHKPFDVKVDADGNSDPIPPLSVPLPEDEGVFTLQVDLVQRRFTNALLRNAPPVQTLIQLVVTGSLRSRSLDAIVVPAEPWSEVGKIDLADPEWWKPWNLLPQIPLRPVARRQPVGSGPLTLATHGDQQYYELGAAKWIAAPLPIAEVGRPHVLEIAYPNDVPQTVGITVLEPNAAGIVTPLFLDSGFDVPDYPRPDMVHVETHRLVFWPRTKNPWVLITNRRADSAAKFGQLLVRAGPDRLPAASDVPASEGATRLLAAYFDKPLFPQTFMSAEALESSTTPPRSLNDWGTFYDGGQRLVEYLRYTGYNSAIISVARDGSTLYPSQLLESTPRFDNGAFFVTGQDPMPKDVLELLFRLFDKAGLTLIPAFHFASPLPELERILLAEDPTTEGIRLRNALGKTFVESYGSQRGLAPYYNPLDERVQAAIKNVMNEVVSRYAHHPSFGGVSLQLAPETYVQLPDEEWGQDARTWSRFQRDTATARADEKGIRERWLDWRAEILADFYRDLTLSLPRQNPHTKLYLATAGSMTAPHLQNEMKPRLSGRGDFSDAMLRQGLDAGKLAQANQVMLLRPRRLSPLVSLTKQGANIAINRSADVDRFYEAAAVYGAMNFHDPMNLRLSEFDELSPFGKAATTTWLSAHLSRSGKGGRARFTRALAGLDAKALVDGGSMIPLGQEDAVRELFATYLRLPAGDFTTIAPRPPTLQPPTVTLRTRVVGSATYFYLVNDSPFSTEVTLELDASDRLEVRSLRGRNVERPQRVDGQLLWQTRLKSFDLQAFTFNSREVQIVNWVTDFPQEQQLALQHDFAELQARVNALSNNRRPSPALPNPGFEQPLVDGRIPGWKHTERPGVSIGVDTSSARGSQSLHLKVEDGRAIGWVRSDEFPIPATGRLSIFAWVRTAPGKPQPALRIAVDLLTTGRDHEYFSTALGIHIDEKTGNRTPVQPLPTEWPELPFLFHFTELPLDGPTHFAIGFDLVGEGEVWIDDVRVSDLYFHNDEHDQLLRNHSIAAHSAKIGKLSESHHYLDGYWPRFLQQFVHPPAAGPRLAIQPAKVAPPPKPEPERRSTWDRFVPRLPLFRR